MRPTKLTMEGFGSYYDKTIIDFDKFGENGIYLISGDTGAGKTTIFDAIVYALYDSASGEVRDVKNFRNTSAGPGKETYVELEFLHHNIPYRIRRSPSYTAAKQKGKGTTTRAAKAEFYEKGKLIASGKSQSDALIEELLGLNKEQFRKVSLLPQMAFQNVLSAKTEDRQGVFRSVFGTQAYQDFQNRLHTKTKVLKAETEQVTQQVKELQGALEGIFQEGELFELSKVSEKNARDGAVLNQLEETIRQQNAVLMEKNRRLGILEKEKAAAEQALKALELKEKLEKEYSIQKARYQDHLLQEKQIEEEKLEAANLQKQIPLFEKRLRQEKALQALKETIEEGQKKTEYLQKALETDEKQLEETEAALLSLSSLAQEKEIVKIQLERAEKLALLEKELKKAEEKKDALQREYLENAESARTARSEYQQARQIYLNNQAGVLAQMLEENVPCPVCGSLAHPSPAKLDQKTLTEKELQGLEEYADSISAAEQKKAREAGSAAAAWESLAEQTAQEKTAQKYTLQELKTRSLHLKKKEQEKKSLEQNRKQLQLGMEKAKKLLAEQQKELQQQKESALVLETEIQTSLPEWPYENLNAARKHLQTMLRNQKDYLETKKEMEEEIKTLQASIARQAGAAGKADRTTCRTLEEKVKQQKAEAAADTQKLDADRKEASIVQSRLQANSTLEQRLKTALEKEKKCRETYEIYNDLNTIMNGRFTGTETGEKVELEAYVLQTYFQRILRHASKRLQKMSSDRYSLVNHSDSRKKSGLDVGILDAYSGEVRASSTLSGGETFLASLALALGTSDEIQESAGGIGLDSFFIDEGFGSLDRELAELVITTLAQLAGDHKLIGIISHTEALNRRIHQKIEVSLTSAKHSRAVIRLD